jgi:16S rRNA (guanine527-N7)-methyltransferase
MHPTRIAELLEPFLQGSSATGQRPRANDALCRHISTYIDILLRWNARINLTAIRDPEEIVTRHFGESLFAARQLFPEEAGFGDRGFGDRGFGDRASGDRERAALQGRVSHTEEAGASAPEVITAADLGSGAGFPGIPIKLWTPHLTLTLIESNQKKIAFLREVVRALTLTHVNVFPGRAEQLLAQRSDSDPAGKGPTRYPRFDLVTLRAVERFAHVLPVAASLVSPAGRLALLIGVSQLDQAQATLPAIAWEPPIPVPRSQSRILLVARKS